MGSFSIWHWLIVLIPLALVIGIIVWATRRSRASRAEVAPGTYSYRDPLPLAKAVTVLLWFEIAVAALSLFAGARQMQLLTQMGTGELGGDEAIAAAEANDLLVSSIGLVQFGLYLLLAFLILKWIYRSNANARALGAKAMEYTPGWAIGWYFVPVLWLWKPFQAFREIWRASARGAGEAADASTPLLGIWWALWIISGVAGQAAFRLSMREDASLEELQMATVAMQVADVLTIAIDLVFMTLIQRLARMQTSWRSAPNAEAFA